MTFPLHTKKDSHRPMNSRIAWLEAEHYEKAGNINQNIDDENNQWKTYLNNLAYLGFEEWLQRQLPDMRIQPKGVNLKVDKFKVQLITVDNLIDDFVPIPHSNINSPYLAAHFYILVEVLEEMEHLRIHGLIRHDELSKLRDNIQNNTNDYQIPLSCFDNQINNLLHYTRFLEVNAIPIPDIKDEVITNLEKIKDTVTQSLINLGQWWSGEFGEVWQSLEDILTPQTPAWGYPKNITRRGNVNKKSSDYAVRRGKLLDFGLLLNGQRFALTLSMRAEENQEIGVLVQIRPQNEYCLPQDLKLRVTLNHNTEQAESEEAIARECDQIIQLAFSEAHGKQFKVEAIYQDAVVTEEFEL